MNNRIFIDTSFVIAALDKKDIYHHKATQLIENLPLSSEIWTSDAILYEVGNYYSKANRDLSAKFIQSCIDDKRIRIVWNHEILFSRVLKQYKKHQDKKWSFTDCMSFTIMKENDIRIAYSSDQHFQQAGFDYSLR